jgi:transposase
VYNRYSRWGQRGIWKGIFDALAHERKDSLIFIDSSIVRAHRAAAGSKGELAEGIGRSRGGRTSKVHAAVDEYGRPLRLEISGGQLHDSQMMDAFLDWDKEPLAIVADKPYGSNKIRQQIADEGAVNVIPSKSNALKPVPHDPNLYAKRNIVERFFCKMKDMRRLATRFEKTATSFRSMLYIFAFRCWCN